MKQKLLTGNQLKMIAIIAMTIDHLTSVLYPDYPTDWRIITLHIIGRLAAPVFWYFIAEGYYHTHDIKRYAIRLFAFAVISHFAYNLHLVFLSYHSKPQCLINKCHLVFGLGTDGVSYK